MADPTRSPSGDAGTRWEVWTDMFGGYAWGRKKDKTFPTREAAVLARNGIVWHNRGNFYVRQVPVAGSTAEREP